MDADIDNEPRVLGRYVLLAPLASGGMGEVHIAAPTAQNESGQRPLCLVKTLKPGVAGVADYAPRFLDEARVALLLRHENLCRVIDSGESKGELYLAMELIEGVTYKRLATLLHGAGRALTTTQAVALGVALLRGLHAAHIATDDAGRPLGVVHRDVSPHNVMLDKEGHAKVIDFGLATSILKETFTESAVVLGKSAYMAPEQARGEDVTPTCDQYAAAIVIYELLTADRFYGDLPSRAIWSVVGAGTHKPRLWSSMPEPFMPLLSRALAASPAERFASCAAFADALLALAPDADSPEIVRSLGALVRKLEPPELDAIAVARMRLAAWDRPDRIIETSGITERLTEPNPVAPLHGDDNHTAETSSTVMTRPKQLMRTGRRALPIAAALVVVAGLGALGAVVALRPAPTAPVVSTTTPTITTSSTNATNATTPPPPTATPPVVAGVPAVPVATAGGAEANEPKDPQSSTVKKESALPKTTTTKATPTPKKDPKKDDRWVGLTARFKAIDQCANPCVAVLRDSLKLRKDVTAFETHLSTCTEECQ